MKDYDENETMKGSGKLTRMFQWVGKHPGYFVLGTLMVAFLSAQQATQTQNDVQDSSADDLPLFV
jgi:hypothetical protein